MIPAPLISFLTAVGATTGTEVVNLLKGLGLKLYEARRAATGRDGAIRLDEGERTVILTDRISDEGFREVAEGELSETGYFLWNADRESWTQH